MVERLAEDRDALATRQAAFLEALNRPAPERWLDSLKSWIEA
jgi:hypothetical protein